MRKSTAGRTPNRAVARALDGFCNAQGTMTWEALFYGARGDGVRGAVAQSAETFEATKRAYNLRRHYCGNA